MKISLLEDIKGGPYVEFNISGDEDYFHWCKSSSFLYEPVFGLFEDCFDRVSDSFNYYGPTIFVGGKLKELEVELEKTATALNEIKSLSQLLEYLNGKILGGNFIGEMDEEYSVGETTLKMS